MSKFLGIAALNKIGEIVNGKISALSTAMTTGLEKKVDTVAGKGLSAVDVSTAMKTKWDAAQVNVIEKITHNGSALAITSKGVTLTTITDAQVQAKITTALGGITKVTVQVVDAKPATGVANVIYFVKKTGGTDDVHDEYMWIANKWELIGSTKVDLSGYWAKSALTEITTAEVEAAFA